MSAEIMVNLDISLASLLMALGVFILTIMTSHKKDRRLELLGTMSGMSVITSTVYVLLIFVEGRLVTTPVMFAMCLSVILEVACNIFCIYWLYYVLYIMYKSEDYLKKMQRIFNLPFIVMVVLDFVNTMTGILWYYDDNMGYHETTLYLIHNLIRYGFIITALVMYAIFKKNEGKVHFFNIWLSACPFVLGGIAEWVTGYLVFNLGLSIGICMLYMGISAEIGFLDSDTGFYNRFYLTYLKDLVVSGEFKLASIITYKFDNPGDMPKFSDSLIQLLPDDCETVRIDDKTIVTLSETTDRGLVYMLSEDVRAICEEMGTVVDIDNEVKGKKEDPVDFFADNIKTAI